MPDLPPTIRTEPPPDVPPAVIEAPDATVVEFRDATHLAVGAPTTLADALVRMAEAEDTLRAIGAGEVDAFVVSDGGGVGRRVFTLSTADRPYRKFVENMREGAATLSSSGLILYANRRLAELLSYSRESIVGSPLTRFLADGSADGPDAIPDPGEPGATVELDLLDANGIVIPVLVGTSPLEVDGDRLTCLTFTDLSAQKEQEREIARLSQAQAERMTELQAAQAALTRQATHDPLTGLPNRTLLLDRIDQALAHSKRSGLCTAVLFVDLDRFKRINDTRGHAAGDALLCRVATQLSTMVRPMDTVARIGGDEFVILVTEIESHLHAVDVSERIVTELGRRPKQVAEQAAHRAASRASGREPGGLGDLIAASVGISVSVDGTGTAESLVHEADTAMYQAKKLGGRRAQVFDTALGRQVKERSIAHQTLQLALNDRRVILYYQPLIELSTGSVAGFEALVRIAEQDGSILAPGAFIPAAEDSGLIVPLGAQVLEMACREATRWRPVGLPERRLTVAVNLSSRQVESGDLSTIVDETLQQTGLDPSRLHLELTETAIMDLQPDILQQLGRIRDLGVQLGLDDFGTGYASLTHLRRLPLTFVKIDRSFVQGLETSADDQRIVAAVVDLAANLGLRSIAEGVETDGQLARLRLLGCDQAQGYLFAHPMPPTAVPATLQHSAW